MKEYKTIKVSPQDESSAIQYYESFGWKLEDTREVYNESQEIVGISENIKPYNSFMQGFTGNSGRIDSNVQTRTNVTHFLSMRFSRDTDLRNYDRISALQNEYENIKFLTYAEMPKKPILFTVLGIFGFISIMLPVGAIISWIIYVSKRKKAIKQNNLADETNPKLQERCKQLIDEARSLVEESNAA